MKITVTRQRNLPDPVYLERYKRCPDLGPKILFFSGGTALRKTCTQLIQYSHNTIHIITPFDSGGSSAKLREAFHMPAIGDVRNRLLALADQSVHGFPEIYRLFSHRFSNDDTQNEFRNEIVSMIKGRHRLVAKIPDPMRKIIRHYLLKFYEKMPKDFDLRKASIGNLILTGGYLETHRHMDPVIYIFSKLVQVRGIVRPVVNEYLHLAADLENGETIVEQHNMTGKEVDPIQSKIVRLYLTNNRNLLTPAAISIRNKTKLLIAQADLICYPFGSFFSSLIANLLPHGVASAIADAPCPKVFVPNTSDDPETVGLTVNDQVNILLNQLQNNLPCAIPQHRLINYILLDQNPNSYPNTCDIKALKRIGLEILHFDLVSSESFPFIDEHLVAPVLFSLA